MYNFCLIDNFDTRQVMAIEKTEAHNKDILGKVPHRLGHEALSYLTTTTDMPDLDRVTKQYKALFQPVLDHHRLLTYVVLGNTAALKKLVVNNWGLFFKKGRITDPASQTFYNVSPYQLMIFLCDKDMRNQIMAIMPKTIRVTRDDQEIEIDLEALRKAQYAEIATGGADLVKLDCNPTQVEFAELTRYITSVTIENQPKRVVFPLLENVDGIIFYQDTATQTMHLYYANKATQQVELIKLSKEQNQALDSLYASFASMENNSSRRSSNEEHALIERTTQRSLSREGILYTDPKGVLYRDNRMEFRYINSARKCLRLDRAGLDDEANAVWRSGIGGAQRQVFWLLQRFCEKNRPFYPLPNFYASPFLRSFIIFNWLTMREEPVFSGGSLAAGFGSEFAIYKGGGPGLCMPGGGGGRPLHARDLVAVNWLIEDAKASVVEFTADKKPGAENMVLNRLPGLG
jgi:hypothetical protein